jgi:hypothetical protein
VNLLCLYISLQMLENPLTGWVLKHSYNQVLALNPQTSNHMSSALHWTSNGYFAHSWSSQHKKKYFPLNNQFNINLAQKSNLWPRLAPFARGYEICHT